MNEEDYKEFYPLFLKGGYEEEFTFPEFVKFAKRCGRVAEQNCGYLDDFDIYSAAKDLPE